MEADLGLLQRLSFVDIHQLWNTGEGSLAVEVRRTAQSGSSARHCNKCVLWSFIKCREVSCVSRVRLITLRDVSLLTYLDCSCSLLSATLCYFLGIENILSESFLARTL